MKKVSVLLDKLLLIAKDTGTWLKVLVLVITGFGGAIMFSKTKTKIQDCTACESERSQLLNFIIDVKKDVSHMTSYNGTPRSTDFSFASYDTLPKNNQYQQSAKRVVTKIDSMILKMHMDSLKRVKQ